VIAGGFPFHSPRRRAFFLFLFFFFAGLPVHAAEGDCVFTKRPPVTLKNMGPCDFDPDTYSFKGTPAEQAACLARPVGFGGEIAKEPGKLPEDFLKRVGTSTDLPKRADVAAYVVALGFALEFGIGLPLPVSHANNGDPDAPEARYFVIHDTSAPNFGSRNFPDDLDWNMNINSLNRFRCANAIEPAHYFINRRGQVLKGHDYIVPWRATKFETATNFDLRLRGLFLHNELVQPRRSASSRGWRNDFEAPAPGYSQIQYERLALAYIVASVRAGKWMIPAFHAVIDDGIYDKHDDPQNFEFEKFNAAIGKLLIEIPKAEEGVRNRIP
jgi:hypothetical protein